VVNLLRDLKRRLGLTLLFIAHDLAVVEYISDRIVVMYLGRVMEMAPGRELCRNPKHPYTEALLSAVPVPDPDRKGKRIVLEGDIPSPINPPSRSASSPASNTVRKRATSYIIRSLPSDASTNVMSSIIGRMLARALKSIVTSESIDVPEGHPRIKRPPEIRRSGETSIASGDAPITI